MLEIESDVLSMNLFLASREKLLAVTDQTGQQISGFDSLGDIFTDTAAET